MKTKLKNTGFTIVELIVVMAIIAILIIMAIPTFTKYIDRANNLSESATAATLYKAGVDVAFENMASSTPYRLQDTVGSNFSSSDTINATLNTDVKARIDKNINVEVRMYSQRNPIVYTDTKPSNPYYIPKQYYDSKWLVFLPGQVAIRTILPFGDVYIVSPTGKMYINGVFYKSVVVK